SARDECRNAKRPQIKDAGVASELPVLEIAYVDVTIGNATFIPLIGHYGFLFLLTGRDAKFETTIAWKGRTRDTSTGDRFGNFAARALPRVNVILGQHREHFFACPNLARELPDSWALLRSIRAKNTRETALRGKLRSQ